VLRKELDEEAAVITPVHLFVLSTIILPGPAAQEQLDQEIKKRAAKSENFYPQPALNLCYYPEQFSVDICCCKFQI
jgi:hypothetical protein